MSRHSKTVKRRASQQLAGERLRHLEARRARENFGLDAEQRHAIAKVPVDCEGASRALSLTREPEVNAVRVPV